MEQLIPFISDIGFPILVAFYLLYRMETKLDAVIMAIHHLPDRMRTDSKV